MIDIKTCFCGDPKRIGTHSMLHCKEPKHLFDALESGVRVHVVHDNGEVEGTFVSAGDRIALIRVESSGREYDPVPPGSEAECRVSIPTVRTVTVIPPAKEPA